MFKVYTRAAWLSCCIGVMMSVADARAAATVSLKAVAKNGVPIAPTNDITVALNDTITAEVRFSGWAHPTNFDAGNGDTGLVRLFQGQLDGLVGVQSSGPNHGLVLPIGYDAPLIKIPCPCTNPRYPTCVASLGACVGPAYHPEQMASMNKLRVDFILAGFSSQTAVATDSLDIKWGGTNLESEGQPDTQCVGGTRAGNPCLANAECLGGGSCQVGSFYAGTLNLKAMPADLDAGTKDMCGDFTFNFKGNMTVTYIGNPLPIPAIVMPAREPLVIHGPQCPPELVHIVSSNPPHCAIDARVPFPQGQPALRRGFQSIVLTFSGPAGANEDSASDYTVQQFPPTIATTISSVVLNGSTATITFAQPIVPRRWTCVLHNSSNTRACLGYLPADANGDTTAAPADILEIIDNLNGVRNPPLTIYQCDIDRSALCAPADILTEIDLLNGASGYAPPANGLTIGACPSMTVP